MFHSFGSLVSQTHRHTKWTFDMAVECEMKKEVRQKKTKKQKTKLYFNQADEKGSLVPQVQEVLLELRMWNDWGYKMHKL